VVSGQEAAPVTQAAGTQLDRHATQTSQFAQDSSLAVDSTGGVKSGRGDRKLDLDGARGMSVDKGIDLGSRTGQNQFALAQTLNLGRV